MENDDDSISKHLSEDFVTTIKKAYRSIFSNRSGIWLFRDESEHGIIEPTDIQLTLVEVIEHGYQIILNNISEMLVKEKRNPIRAWGPISIGVKDNFLDFSFCKCSL